MTAAPAKDAERLADKALMKRAAELVRTSELPHNRIATLEEQVSRLRRVHRPA